MARLRIFAGPNGSGKSTFFESFSRKYDAGVFLNADNLERDLTTKGYIDLSEFGLNLTQEDLNEYLNSPRAKSLINKAKSDNHQIEFSLRENIIVGIPKDTRNYEGALISAFLRNHLQSN